MSARPQVAPVPSTLSARLGHPAAPLPAPQAGADWTLRPGQPCRPAQLPAVLEGGVLHGLTVVRGTVWVTWPGQWRDHLLEAGQPLALPADLRGVLVESDPRRGAPGACVRWWLAPEGAGAVDCAPSCPYPTPLRRPFPIPLLTWGQRLLDACRRSTRPWRALA
ncbi:DUF2917 domain-containing protein [Ideonella livida]|uniref:DUF2917 domain-containing protein n=1 Tax=Ideonella livida TaxID=2707176 RepID=A0A7C9PE90_9BURK|nr:DUF2917 domain-containing protein [Ideonella livida]NDY89633.1 DUF2917 domain-containing protein [Ideonella livida]